MVDFIKSFLTGLAVVVIVLWCIYSIGWLLGILFSVGGLWGQTWLWANIAALIPWSALVIFLLALLGEDVRNS